MRIVCIHTEYECVNSNTILTSNADINECDEHKDDCDTNADCTNTVGSYTCACKTGYTGNGKSCNGTCLRVCTKLQRFMMMDNMKFHTRYNQQHIWIRSNDNKCWNGRFTTMWILFWNWQDKFQIEGHISMTLPLNLPLVRYYQCDVY